MSKVAHYLQEHILGEVTEGADAREHFSTDGSILTLTPSIVVYPRNEHDVRKTVRFVWQLAERGRVIPITARGSGTDYTGASLGSGIVVTFPAYMNRIVQLDTKTGECTVEPGIVFGRLQQTLHTHDRFIPSYPASINYSSIGGAVSNNAGGERSFKYGAMDEHVKSLRVVLSNGEVITTERLSKRELSKKLGLSTFEGEIYRQLDALLEDNKDLIEKIYPAVSMNTAGYNLAAVKKPNGSFDLTPLFVGSQSTLGLISEVTLTTEVYNPETSAIMAQFDSVQSAIDAADEIRKMQNLPCSLQMVDGHLLSFVHRLNPNQLKATFSDGIPKAVLFIEFDDASDRQRKKTVKRAGVILEKYATEWREATDEKTRTEFGKVRYASASLLSHSEKRLKAIPIIDDCIVPIDRYGELIKAVYELFAREKLQVALWGDIGSGSLRVFPFFDISEVGGRQRAFRLYEEYYKIVLKLGGSTSAQHNDGRLRGPLLRALYGENGYKLLENVKQIFDPYGIMNPGVKVGARLDEAKQLLRTNYSLGHLYNHLPKN